MTQAVPCVYCGCTGYHMWVGSSMNCPGAASEREREAQAAAEIERLSKLYRASLGLLVEQGKLIARAADALEYWNDSHDSRAKFLTLIDELRKAAR